MYIFPQVGGYGYIDKRTYSVAADQLYETLSSVYSGLTIREIADYPPRQSYGSVVAAVFRPEVSEQQRKAGLQKIIVDLGLTETTAVNGFRIYTGRIQGYEKIVAIRNEVLLDFSSTTKAIDSNLSVVVNKMLALFGPA